MAEMILLYAISFFLLVVSVVILAVAKKYNLVTDIQIQDIAKNQVDAAMELRRGLPASAIVEAIKQNLPEKVKILKATDDELLEKASNYK